jgi:E3 ubiquitin-protein ligase HERC1
LSSRVSSEANKKFLLMTLFACSLKMDAEDVSLAASCGLLPILLEQCRSPEALCRSSCTVLFNTGSSHLDTLLTVASARALHIVALCAG